MRIDRQPWPGAMTRPPASLRHDDMTYMARALLQLADENAALRERLVALEMAFATLQK